MTEDGTNLESSVGIVAIGRNEGERLRACFDSMPEGACAVVYVDSGSTDGSLGLARERGIEVVELDLSVPFTAARARNEGIARLRKVRPDVCAVHVIDGDCAFDDGWFEVAVDALQQDERIAVMCGNRREREPGSSVYNRLCDIEWGETGGDVLSCGGDALFRLEAFDAVGGFDPTLIAGEEPELCFRLRASGWRIVRVNRTMAWHNADMTRFSQWWKRAVRAGFAAIEGAAMHGRSPERYNVARVRRVVVWALLLPLMTVVLGAVWFPWGFGLVLIYALQWARLVMRELRRRSLGVSVALATGQIVDKFAQLVGMLTYLSRRVRGEQGAIIEYKGAEETGVSSS